MLDRGAKVISRDSDMKEIAFIRMQHLSFLRREGDTTRLVAVGSEHTVLFFSLKNKVMSIKIRKGDCWGLGNAGLNVCKGKWLCEISLSGLSSGIPGNQ